MSQPVARIITDQGSSNSGAGTKIRLTRFSENQPRMLGRANRATHAFCTPSPLNPHAHGNFQVELAKVLLQQAGVEIEALSRDEYTGRCKAVPPPLRLGDIFWRRCLLVLVVDLDDWSVWCAAKRGEG